MHRMEDAVVPKISEFVNDVVNNFVDYDECFVLKNAVSTGYKGLDRKLGGFKRGGLYLLGGVPEIGTTAMAVSIIYKTAIKEGHRVLYYTTQTSASEITERLLRRMARISYVKEETGPEDDAEIKEAADQLKEADIYVSDVKGKSLSEILEDEYTSNGNKAFDLIVVDHLEGVYDTVLSKEGLYSFKILAKEYNCPILVITKLDCIDNPRGNNLRPVLENFRTLALSDYVDTYMVLFRGDFFGEKGMKGIAELYILKSNDCIPDVVEMIFLEEFRVFVDCETL